MIFKPMPREDVLKALEGHKDILGPAVEANNTFFKKLACPACGEAVMPIVNAKQLFRKDDVLPNYLAKCKTCGVEFEPYTGIQVTLPRSF